MPRTVLCMTYIIPTVSAVSAHNTTGISIVRGECGSLSYAKTFWQQPTCSRLGDYVQVNSNVLSVAVIRLLV